MTAGQILIEKVDAWAQHCRGCQSDECPACDALFNQVMLAHKVWESSEHKDPPYWLGLIALLVHRCGALQNRVEHLEDRLDWINDVASAEINRRRPRRHEMERCHDGK